MTGNHETLTPGLFRLLDAMTPDLKPYRVHLWGDGPTAHIFAESFKDARQRVLEMNPSAKIVGISEGEPS
jgi:hypothetical protein